MNGLGGVRHEHGVAIAQPEGLQLDGLTLRGISEAGIRTSLHVPEWDLLVDLGCVDSSTVPAKHVLVTHGHLDHLGAFANHVALRGLFRMAPASYLMPPGLVGPAEELLELWRRIDKAPLEARVLGLPPGQSHALRRDLVVHSHGTVHRVESQAYRVVSLRHALKAEFRGLAQGEIHRRKAAGEVLEEELEVGEIAFSGDTTLEGILAHPELLRVRRLVLECTFFGERVDVARSRHLGHVHLDEIAAHAEAFEVEWLVLMHRSVRFSAGDAARHVRARLPKDLRERVVLFG